jgi:two-component system CheB/CheR fusion protein
MPSDSGMAFIVVTHHHPGHTSLLPALIGKRTRMPVVEASDGTVVQPNCVYLSVPESYLAIFNESLHFIERAEPGALRLPIDYFFRSLAEDRKEKAVGIVLSGTGTDGTLGVRAIKGANGMVMAQEPESAKYRGMPDSALATGLVDYKLPAEQLPKQLLAYANGSYLATTELPHGAEIAFPEPMQKILVLLRSRSGHDFSSYKLTTVRRRIERRMNVHEIEGPVQYVRYLQENPHELDLLFKELLIGVTSFFRDPEAFEALMKSALGPLLVSLPDSTPLRFWVPGCSTGEEAFTLAILLQEFTEQSGRSCPVQIFATDLDSAAIDDARSGFFPDGIAEDVSAARLKRFFVREDTGYRIKKNIREMVVFAPQNLIKDPPFTRLDLISCRNLLIYLNGEVQKRLLSLFHYALKPGGLLMLGPSESISGFGDDFSVLNKKWKIFARKTTHATTHPLMDLPSTTPKAEPASTTVAGAIERGRATHLTGLLEKHLLKRFAPATLIVNERGDILYIHGRTGDYLEPPTGQPRMNILEMAREGLRLELPALLRRAGAQAGEVVHEGVRVKANGDFIRVNITVSKISEPEAVRGLLLVTFKPVSGPESPPARRSKRQRPQSSTRAQELERELQYTKESLQSTVEELETSNEELKSTNEELQSTNEELQSTNEEMETSKEEMQSLNEELQTVNAQLQGKVDELAQASSDMQNLLNSTEIATIFLDNNLKIKRFTSEAKTLVKLIPSDVGRSIGDIVSTLEYGQLERDADEVLRTLAFKEKEVRTKDGDWRLMRIMPYRTIENIIDGLVITFVDINKATKALQTALDARRYADRIVAAIRQPLAVLDAGLRVVSANPAFHLAFELTREGAQKQPFHELRDWGVPGLGRLLYGVLATNSPVEKAEFKCRLPSGARRSFLLNAHRLEEKSDSGGFVLLAFEESEKDRAPVRSGNGPAAVRRSSPKEMSPARGRSSGQPKRSP